MPLLGYAFLTQERDLHADADADTLPSLAALTYEPTGETVLQELMDELEMDRKQAEEAAAVQLRILINEA